MTHSSPALTRRSTAVSGSPPGAKMRTGSRRQPATSAGQPASTSRCRSPSQAPCAISAKPGSGTSGGAGRPQAAMAAATAAAVCAVRRSGEWMIATGSPGGRGNRGAAAGSARRMPARAAWRSPSPDSGVSACPWKRPSASQTDCPCRSRTSDAARSGGTASGGGPPGPSVTRRPRARSSRGPGLHPARECARRRHPGRPRRGRAPSMRQSLGPSARGASR